MWVNDLDKLGPSTVTISPPDPPADGNEEGQGQQQQTRVLEEFDLEAPKSSEQPTHTPSRRITIAIPRLDQVHDLEPSSCYLPGGPAPPSPRLPPKHSNRRLRKRALFDLLESSGIHLTLPRRGDVVPFLLLVGLLIALLSALIQYVILLLRRCAVLISELDLASGELRSGAIALGLMLLFTTGLLLAATLLTRFAPSATGSGLPEIRVILSGAAPLPSLLRLRTLVVKVIGAALAIGAGAPLGLEGPQAHMAAIIAQQLTRLPFFSRLRERPALMQQMISAAASAGVASTFGAPLGGMLFAIEMVSSYFRTRNYWQVGLAAYSGALFFRYFFNLQFGAYFLLSEFLVEVKNGPLSASFGLGEWLRTCSLSLSLSLSLCRSGSSVSVFALLGIVCGLLGVMYIRLHGFLSRRLRAARARFPHLLSPEAYALYVSVAITLVVFPRFFSFMAIPSFEILSDLFNPTSLEQNRNWDSMSPAASLTLFALLRLVLIILSVHLSVPCGFVLPMMTIGAALGRLMSMGVTQLPDALLSGGRVLSTSYSIAGAAALAAGITQGISPAIIIFEISGRGRFLVRPSTQKKQKKKNPEL
jgi:H+/Cl- antiporter ClcA